MANVLITGSGGGIGTALAKKFLRDGHNLLLHCRNRTCDLSREVNQHNKNVEFFYGDLAVDNNVAMLGFQAQQFNVNILVNNAGVHMAENFSAKTIQEIEAEMYINTMVPILLTHWIWNSISEHDKGLVVNINSVAGKNGAQGESIYCASKHALDGFGKALQYDGTLNNVRVLNVVLAAVRTTMTKNRADYDKLMDPDEVADVVVGLCRSYESLNVDEVVLTRRNF